MLEEFFPAGKIGPTRTIPEPLYLVDLLVFIHSPQRLDGLVLGQIYLKEGQTAAQIGEQVGLSKQAVLSRLRDAGIKGSKGRGRCPDNFRYPYPPFGYRVRSGKLVTHRKEMRIARLVVEMRDRQELRWSEIGERLNKLGFRSRTGLNWSSVRVRRVHKYWSGKL